MSAGHVRVRGAGENGELVAEIRERFQVRRERESAAGFSREKCRSRTPRFVQMAKSRRGAAISVPLPKTGGMASRNGSASAAPVVRRKVRRESGERAMWVIRFWTTSVQLKSL